MTKSAIDRIGITLARFFLALVFLHLGVGSILVAQVTVNTGSTGNGILMNNGSSISSTTTNQVSIWADTSTGRAKIINYNFDTAAHILATWACTSLGGVPYGGALVGATGVAAESCTLGNASGTAMLTENSSGSPSWVLAPMNTPSTAHQWFTSYTASSGVFGTAQPAISDLTATFNPPLSLSTNTLSLTCGAGQVMGGATPSCTSAPTLGASGTLGSLTMGNATSGTITVEPVAGALGTVIVSIPAATDTLANLAGTQSLSNKTVDGVTPTTMGYVDATSSIQTQLNAKAPLASPTFTGTVKLPDGTTITASGFSLGSTFPTLNQNTTGTAGGLSGTPNISVGTLSTSGSASFGSNADKIGQAVITSDVGPITSEAIVVQTPALSASRIQAGTTIRCVMFGASSGGTTQGTSPVFIHVGTGGNTSDTKVFSYTISTTGNGNSIPFKLEFLITFRTVGSSSTAFGSVDIISKANTGLITASAVTDTLGTYTSVNTTAANLIISFGISTNASPGLTIHNAEIEFVNQ